MSPEFADHRPGEKRRAWGDVLVRDLRRSDAPTCARLLAEREGWSAGHCESVVEGWLAAAADASISLVAERHGVVHAYGRAAVLEPAADGGRGPNGWYLVGLGFTFATSDFLIPGVRFTAGAGALYRWTRAARD